MFRHTHLLSSPVGPRTQVFRRTQAFAGISKEGLQRMANKAIRRPTKRLDQSVYSIQCTSCTVNSCTVYSYILFIPVRCTLSSCTTHSCTVYKLSFIFMNSVQVIPYIHVQCTSCPLPSCTVYKLYHTFLYSVQVLPYIHVQCTSCTVHSSMLLLYLLQCIDNVHHCTVCRYTYVGTDFTDFM